MTDSERQQWAQMVKEARRNVERGGRIPGATGQSPMILAVDAEMEALRARLQASLQDANEGWRLMRVASDDHKRFVEECNRLTAENDLLKERLEQFEPRETYEEAVARAVEPIMEEYRSKRARGV